MLGLLAGLLKLLFERFAGLLARVLYLLDALLGLLAGMFGLLAGLLNSFSGLLAGLLCCLGNIYLFRFARSHGHCSLSLMFSYGTCFFRF
jgi:hypothetical protein